MRCRTKREREVMAVKGMKRNGRPGHRVNISYSDSSTLRAISVYPEDARKFALELLQMADECEKP